MDIIDALDRRRRAKAVVMALVAIAVVVFELLVILPAGYIHAKLLVAAGALLLVGMWRVLRTPWWIRRPDEIDRIEAGAHGTLQIIMRGGRLYEVVADREELELAIQKRANELLLRARVVRR